MSRFHPVQNAGRLIWELILPHQKELLFELWAMVLVQEAHYKSNNGNLR